MAAEFYSEEEKQGSEVALIEEDSSAGADVRARIGERLIRDVGRMWRTPGLQIGYRYEDSPICIHDGSPPYPDEPADFVPSTRPGSRAPHAWLSDGRSTLDLYGRGFVLLRLGTNSPETSEIEWAAKARCVPLETITVTDPNVIELYRYRLVMVRPDGHVAWRANTVPSNAGAIIDRARGMAVTQDRK